MNKYVIPAILGAVVLMAGIFAFAPVQKAQTVHTAILAGVRDNLVITDIDITVPDAQVMVLADNAGIGGVSDVELVWKIADVNCAVATFAAAVVTNAADDTALDAIDATLNHDDVANVEAVLLRGIGGGACDLVAGDFVTVSTIGT